MVKRNYESRSSSTKERANWGHKTAASLALAASAFNLAGCGGEDKVPVPEVSQSTTANPKASEKHTSSTTPDSAPTTTTEIPKNETPEQKADRLLKVREANLSPEKLSAMSGPELAKAFRISKEEAPDALHFVEAITANVEAQYNAGCTKKEWQPWIDQGRDTFANAMIEKYSSSVKDEETQWFAGRYDKNFARGLLNNCDVMFSAQRYNPDVKEQYHISYSVNKDSLKTTLHDNGTYDVKWTVDITDNSTEDIVGPKNTARFKNVEFGSDNVGPLPDGSYGSPIRHTN